LKVRFTKAVPFSPISYMPQIHTADFTSKRRPISKAGLAKEVAKSLKKYIAVEWRKLPLELGLFSHDSIRRRN
jgi:hypothetical protein